MFKMKKIIDNRPMVLTVTRRHRRKHKWIDYTGEFHLELLIRLGVFPIMVPVVRGTAMLLFAELEKMMEDVQNHQEYYEAAYERLIEKNVPFYALDISGLKWTEIDTKEDFITAEKIFN